MITEMLRGADPAAELESSPTSSAAEAMLRDVLATPRYAPRRPSVRWRSLAVGTAAAGVAAALTFALAGPAEKGGDARPVGYTVDQRSDGSVDVTVDFAQFKDPKALQRSLDARGVRAVVLSQEARSAAIRSSGNGLVYVPAPAPPCAKYTPYPRAERAVQTGREPRFDESTLHLYPDRVPSDATFLIEIGTHGGRVQMIAAGVVVGTPPTCF